MSKKRNSKLVIHIGEVQVEGDSKSIAFGEHVLRGFLNVLKNLQNDLNSQGIDTTIIVGGEPLDERMSEASK